MNFFLRAACELCGFVVVATVALAADDGRS